MGMKMWAGGLWDCRCLVSYAWLALFRLSCYSFVSSRYGKKMKVREFIWLTIIIWAFWPNSSVLSPWTFIPATDNSWIRDHIIQESIRLHGERIFQHGRNMSPLQEQLPLLGSLPQESAAGRWLWWANLMLHYVNWSSQLTITPVMGQADWLHRPGGTLNLKKIK